MNSFFPGPYSRYQGVDIGYGDAPPLDEHTVGDGEVRDNPEGGHSLGPPFSPFSILKDGASYKVRIYPGWVIDTLTTGYGASDWGKKFYMPVSDAFGPGETPLNEGFGPEFTMSLGDFLYVVYDTDDYGVVMNDPYDEPYPSKPRMVVQAGPLAETIRYQPSEGGGYAGTEGEYWVPVLYLEDAGGGVLRVVTYQNSDIEHYHDLPTHHNVGGGHGVFKGRDPDEDRYEWKSLEAGTGVTITPKADTLEISTPVAPSGSPDSGKIRLLEGAAYTTLVQVDTGAVIDIPTDQIIYVRSYEICTGSGFETKKFLTLD